MPGADYHRGILAWLPEIWSMQQEAGVEGGEFDDENDINKSYHDLCVETALARSTFFAFAQRPISDAAFACRPCARQPSRSSQLQVVGYCDASNHRIILK